MRKIKPKKTKDNQNKKVLELMNELLRLHNEVHDTKKISETAKKIYNLKPTEPVILEHTAAICIDNNIIEIAEDAINYLEKIFPPAPYRLFLHSRVCDLKRDYGGCIKYAEKALSMPNVEMLHKMMIHNILGHAYRFIGNAEKFMEHYGKSAKMTFESVTDPEILAIVEKIRREDYSNYLFSIHNINVSREKIFEEIVGFNKLHEYEVPFTHSPQTHPKHKKIRLGYVSPDIRRHVVAFFSYAFYKSYDKSRFEVYIYAKNLEDDATREFAKGVDAYRNICFDSAQQAAQKIKDDEIDILIDLSGHTANNCLNIVAYKPAPIIISGIGWFNSTGFKPVDYFIVDKFTDPVGLNEKFFTEKLLRLQHSHFCYMWHDAPTPVTPAPCKKKGYVTFVSFNNFPKVTDEILRTWAKILDAVPNSKLFIKTKAFRDKFGTDYALGRIKAAGISLDRFIYEQDEQNYLHKYNETDIALDTFPYPGGGTTCDALYMGVPVITLVGDRHNSRFGYSLLHNIGLDELCAFSEEEYIQKAVELANDWDRLGEYHLTIRRKMETSPVMNDTIYMAEIEAAYEKIFHAWQNSETLPEFPQDAEKITPQLAENYFERAKNYLDLQKQNENIINVKRALYYLELAAQADEKDLAEIYLLTADCRKKIKNYVGAYESICKCGEVLEKSAEVEENFLCNYYKLRGELELLNGKSFDAAKNFENASNCAENDSKFALASSAFWSLNFLDLPSEDLAKVHFEYQKLLENIKPFTTYHEKNQRVKIGYISPDFRTHPIFPLIFGMIGCHDKNKFEVTCYSLNDDDDLTANFKNNVEHFVSVKNLSFEKIAEKIHADNTDILIELTGHGEGNALPVLAYKPAPIQISGIGYANTTGMNAVDYFITDTTVDPPGEHETFFTEKFLYMPCQFCYAQRRDVAEPKGAPCIENGYVTFGTICRYTKINDDMLQIWKIILDKLPSAKFFIRAVEFESISTMDQAYSRMKNFGFNMDQITFLPPVDNYMNEMQKVDLMLDTYPYVGCSTTLDALFMGVPVLTLYGERRGTRTGLSILKNIGLEDLAVDSVENYINRAVALATETETLDVLHKNLRTMIKNSNALNTGIYAKIFEERLLSVLNS